MTDSERIIFVINLVIYSINNLGQVAANAYLLTPKYSKLKTIIIWYCAGFFGGTVKFFMPIGSDYEFALMIVNTAVWLIVSYILCEEKIGGILAAYASTLICSAIVYMVWNVTPYVEAKNTEIGTTIGYLISTPLLFAALALLVRGKRILIERNYSYVNLKIVLLLIVTVHYYVIYGYAAVRNYENGLKNGNGRQAMFIMCAGIIIIAVVFWMVFKKSEEQQQIEEQRALEILHTKEQEDYNHLLKRTEAMEKIRHDFYGQLTTAKHIISQDRQRGMELLGELEETLR